MLTTHKSDDMLKDRPIDRLRVIVLDLHYLLLQERDLDWFKEHGPDTFACFHQKSARQAIQDRWLRELKRESKRVDNKPKE